MKLIFYSPIVVHLPARRRILSTKTDLNEETEACLLGEGESRPIIRLNLKMLQIHFFADNLLPFHRHRLMTFCSCVISYAIL